MIRHSDPGAVAAAIILWTILAWGPIAFGGVQVRDRAFLAAAAGVALAVAVIGRRDLRQLRTVAMPAAMLTAVAGFGLLQSLTWPSMLSAVVAPELAAIWRETRSLLGAEAGGGAPLSLAPAVSRRTALEWLAVACCLGAASLVSDQRRLRRLLGFTILGMGLFGVIYGADNWFRQSTSIWDVEVPGDPSRLRGTFVNPDHFAFYLSLSTCLCFAWLWWAVRRLSRGDQLEKRVLNLAFPAMLFLVLFVGLAFTGSRAGLIAASGALIAQTLFLTILYRRWQAGILGVLAFTLGLGGVLLFGWQQGLGRFLATSAYEVAWNARTEVYLASLELWWSFPLTGTGLGTFREAFPLVQPADLPQTWIHAHSDILELLVTVGVLGGLPFLGYGLLTLCRRLWRVLYKGRRSEERAAALAGLGAVVAAAIHSLLDFSLTVPANSMSLAIICGLTAAAPTLSAKEEALASQQRHRRRGDRPARGTPRDDEAQDEEERGRAGSSVTTAGAT